MLRSATGQTVYDTLRIEILQLEARPGTDIDEMSLVSRFGVSRTPIREALIRLAAEGLVEMRPNRGARVAALSLDDIPAMISTMELYDRAVAYTAAMSRTEADLQELRARAADFRAAAATKITLDTVYTNFRFHHQVNLATHNPYLAEDASRARSRMLRVSIMVYGKLDSLPEVADEQHQAMIEALEARDSRRAEQLAIDHSDESKRAIAAYLSDDRFQNMAIFR